MNKVSITGWKDVLSFTFIQTMKSKSFIISFLILLIMAVFSIPLVSVLTKNNTGGSGDANSPSPIQKVYIDNQTDLKDMDFSALTKEKAFGSTAFEALSEDYSIVSDRIESSEKTSVIVTISISSKDKLYHLDFVKAGSGSVKSEDISLLEEAVSRQFDANKLSAMGISSDQAAVINASVNTKVTMLNADGNEIVKKDTSISFSEYWFIYGIWFIVLMVNSLAASLIATSVVTEKSTRVIEYLLTSVKPLSLIIGKILAMLAATIIQLVGLFAAVFISNKVTAAFLSDGKDVLSTYIPSNIFANLNPVNLIFCLLFVVFGIIFYGTFAGLAGATISKLEELQEGLVLCTFTNIIGAYIAIGAANFLMGGGTNSFVTFALLFPISSPFIVPGALLVGKVSLPIAAASFALLIILNILLFWLVARVFEFLILHNGNKIKMKDLLKIAKTV